LLLAGPLAAQPERYELGRRLKAFEAAWEKYDTPAGRDRALELLPKLTGQFFAAQFGEAGRTLDLAAYALTTDVGPSAARLWVWSLHATPEARVVDGSAKELTVTVAPFYPVKGDPPKNLELQLWFTNKDVVKVRPDKFPLTVKVPLPPLGEFRGLDRKLYFLADGAKELRPASMVVSQVADLQKRLDRLDERLREKNAPGGANTLERFTARSRQKLVAEAARGEKAVLPPTDMPYADLLANAEAMLAGKPFFTAERSGQFWLTVPTGGGAGVPCRVYVPRGLDPKKPVPVVFALHGAGVDENMFFESYGAGRALRLCEERGWVLVAPRGGLFDADGPPVMKLFDALAGRYPLDPKRVFVVGHSMGAMQAVRQAAGGKFAAVAALAGGGKVGKPAAFKELAVFVGVGDKDSLAASGSRTLAKALREAGAKNVTFKEYPGVEHLVIVGEALPDVFELFDRVAGK
jgi:acetyl esterase/lipase